MSDERAKILDKIQKLLAKAESTTEAERDALLSKVDQFMVEYAIMDHELNKAAGTTRSKPVLHTFRLFAEDSDIWYQLVNLSAVTAEFFGCKRIYGGSYAKGKQPITCQYVGFEEDCRNAEFLYHSLHLQMIQTLVPKYDHSRTFMENMCTFKEVGMKWADMYEIFRKAGLPEYQDPEPPRSVFVRFTKIYADYCKTNNIPQVKANPKNFKFNFCDAYVNVIYERVHTILRERKARERDTTTQSGTSVALVLASRTDEVNEDFERRFGKPKGNITKGSAKWNSAANGAGRSAGSRADLGGSSVPGSRKAIGG